MKYFGSEFNRGNEYFSRKKLGAFGAELAILSGFFETPWAQPVEGVETKMIKRSCSECKQAIDLRALGRLAESDTTNAGRIGMLRLHKRIGEMLRYCQQPQRTLSDHRRCEECADLRGAKRWTR